MVIIELFGLVFQFFACVCIALLRYYNLYFGGEYNHMSYHDRYLFGVVTVGGMILVTAPLCLGHIFGSSIKPGIVRTPSYYYFIWLIHSDLLVSQRARKFLLLIMTKYGLTNMLLKTKICALSKFILKKKPKMHEHTKIGIMPMSYLESACSDTSFNVKFSHFIR